MGKRNQFSDPESLILDGPLLSKKAEHVNTTKKYAHGPPKMIHTPSSKSAGCDFWLGKRIRLFQQKSLQNKELVEVD